LIDFRDSKLYSAIEAALPDRAAMPHRSAEREYKTNEKKIMTKSITIAILACAIAATSGQEAKTPPGSPTEILSRVVVKANAPTTISDDISALQYRIDAWQTAIVKGETKEPVGFGPKPKTPPPFGVPVGGKPTGAYAFIESDFAFGLTPEFIESALGKPDRVAQQEPIPFLLDMNGERVVARVFWYGAVGFGFSRLKTDQPECLRMMLYIPK
jgi:hypothetical protein